MSKVPFQFTPADLQRYIDERAIVARLIHEMGHTPTVPAAAAALGVDPEQIIKTLLFLLQPQDEAAGGNGSDNAVVVISHGERRVQAKLLAAHLGVSKRRVKLAPAETVLALLGYPAGGVPPLGHRCALPVLLDASVAEAASRFEGVVYGGGGDDRTMMRIELAELVRILQPAVVAVS